MIVLARYERRIGRTAEAERLYRQAIPVLDSIVGGRPVIAPALARFGTLLADAGRCEEGVPHLLRATALAERANDREAWLDRARFDLSACAVPSLAAARTRPGG